MWRYVDRDPAVYVLTLQPSCVHCSQNGIVCIVYVIPLSMSYPNSTIALRIDILVSEGLRVAETCYNTSFIYMEILLAVITRMEFGIGMNGSRSHFGRVGCEGTFSWEGTFRSDSDLDPGDRICVAYSQQRLVGSLLVPWMREGRQGRQTRLSDVQNELVSTLLFTTTTTNT